MYWAPIPALVAVLAAFIASPDWGDRMLHVDCGAQKTATS